MERRIRAWRQATAVIAALALMLAACGETAPQNADGGTTTTEMDGSDASSMEGDDHGHAAAMMEVDAAIAPSVAVTVTPDAKSGLNVHSVITGMELAPERAGLEHVDGEGHLHLYVDGVKVGRVYTEWYHLDGLEPGTHEIKVTVNSNTHAELMVDGQPIAASVTVEVPESETTMEHMHADPHSAESQMSVALEVKPDPVSGWNAFATTSGFVWAPEHASTPHQGGEGHAHLYVDGQKIARMYGPVYHFSFSDPGEHEVTISLNGNDHTAYSWEGQPVEATATISVGGEPVAADVTIGVTITDGQVSGQSRHEVTVGDVVAIEVTSDIADELHVHGYDAYVDVHPNEAASIQFTADIPGIFEVELEDSGFLVFELVVR